MTIAAADTRAKYGIWISMDLDDRGFVRIEEAMGGLF